MLDVKSAFRWEITITSIINKSMRLQLSCVFTAALRLFALTAALRSSKQVSHVDLHLCSWLKNWMWRGGSAGNPRFLRTPRCKRSDTHPVWEWETTWKLVSAAADADEPPHSWSVARVTPLRISIPACERADVHALRWAETPSGFRLHRYGSAGMIKAIINEWWGHKHFQTGSRELTGGSHLKAHLCSAAHTTINISRLRKRTFN